METTKHGELSRRETHGNQRTGDARGSGVKDLPAPRGRFSLADLQI